ncbi:MAG TPA: UDP-N-acetylglucosamine 2-epimerase (hydrolyzing) [Elusimicrobia bacterium]|nr:MAG: UDP-N-acetyl-D-glucosamine 2-epimerase, UDP-hydrolysing [Rhodocyclales bacterium GWA2_65_19]HAZ07887.1 UDP-N-acetylglucosamine 2-epimerase (hydrolyzing) [Elusimicrobiota bacterium]
MRKIAVVTVGRSDYGLLRPVLREIAATKGLRLRLIVAGAHLQRSQGLTVREILADGWQAAARVRVPAADTPEGISRAMGAACAGFASAYARLDPDFIVVLGDRYEMHAAALAALPFTIPVAHLHGGELTHGAFDDSLRHSITKLSHLHFTANRAYARRVRQLGEDQRRIFVTGSPAIDNIRSTPLLSRPELEAELGLDLGRPTLLVTFHPTTLEWRDAQRQTRELLAALDASGLQAVVTMPNADTGNAAIRRLLRAFAAGRREARLVESLGSRRYLSLMAYAAAMLGNSSSGLVEAPSLRLPVVNVGTRQGGRLRANNVIDCGYGRAEILRALRRALSPAFRASLRGMSSPYGDGRAAPRVARLLIKTPLQGLTDKRFADLQGGRHG